MSNSSLGIDLEYRSIEIKRIIIYNLESIRHLWRAEWFE